MNHFNQNYPDPPTSVDQAWSKLADMMEPEMTSVVKHSGRRLFSTGFSQLLFSAVAAMVFIGGGTFLVIKINEKSIIQEKKDSKKANTFSGVTDSLYIDGIVEEVYPSDNISKMDHKFLEVSTKKGISKFLLQESVPELDKEDDNQQDPFIDVVQVNDGNIADNREIRLIESIIFNKFLEPGQKMTLLQDHFEREKALYNTSLSEKKAVVNSASKKRSPIFNFSLPFTQLTKKNNYAVNSPRGKPKDRNFLAHYKLFTGVQGSNCLMFSDALNGNIYSYGTLLGIGIHNRRYHFAVETGVGIRFSELHLPFDRVMIIERANGISDSTVTTFSYKYNHQMIDIPILAEKTIYQHNKISFDLKTGVHTLLFISREPLFKSIPSDIYQLERRYDPVQFNFSMDLSPQFRWNVKNHLSLLINPSGSIYMNSLFKEYTVRPYGFTINAGIRYTW